MDGRAIEHRPSIPSPKKATMPVRLDRDSADFDQRFGTFLAAKREVSADVERATRAIVDDVAARGDAALDRGDAQVRPARYRGFRPARDRGRDRGRGKGLRQRDARRAEIRARPDRGVPPPPTAEGRALHRCARRRARLALERDRRGRPLCARRHRGLSVLGADERGAGQGRRRAARGDGGAVARRQAQSAGAGRRASRRRVRDLPRRRRAGGGGAGLRHGDDRAGRQNRRPRQRLCRRRQAAGVRQGRHRHDRRSLGSAGHRRRHRQCRLDRRRSAGAGRARRQRAVDPDHRQRAACRRGRTRRGMRNWPRCRARRSRAPRGTISAPSSW